MILSAGMVITRQIDSHWLYLFLRAYNYWDFPKGEVRRDESPLETALREVKEETGLENFTLRWGRVYKETAPYRGGKKKARYYLAETSESAVSFSINPKIGRAEHHEYRWLAGEELKKFASPRLYPIIDWARDTIEITHS